MDNSNSALDKIANIIVSKFTDKLSIEDLDYEHDLVEPMRDNPPEYRELHSAVLQIAQIIIQTKKNKMKMDIDQTVDDRLQALKAPLSKCCCYCESGNWYDMRFAVEQLFLAIYGNIDGMNAVHELREYS